MKIKKAFSKFIISSAFVSLALVTIPSYGIKSQVVSQNLDQINLTPDLDLKWRNFLNQTAITNILDEMFGDNNQAKDEYIKSQFDLINSPYKIKLKSALKYANLITRPPTAEFNFLSGISYPYPIKQAIEVIDEAQNQNWLWYLYNLTNLVFMQKSNFTRQNNESAAAFAIRDNENKLLYSNFVTLKSNIFIQEVKQVDSDNNVTFYLLNKDGYILQIQIRKDPEESTRDIIFGYIKTYPRLLETNQINEIFNLNKYVNLYASFGLSSNNRTAEVLYKDFYGGILLQYTAVDIN
ncbi:aromatic motif membrane protein [[Mycoplasma] imitans]|uniref:aromatic motif membrane protein n=1 Tax=[Mycoplasma] imitans TaxID=29560 RepID=UPI0004845FC6|nr:aromatic motif membrane protein [[Mycoplasma] imitans]